MMYPICDIAKIFLSKQPMTHKKLQKLCYYTQIWSLYYFQTPLIDTEFQAWVHGPVSPQLYDLYRAYGFTEIPQVDPSHVPALSRNAMYVVNSVYTLYGEHSGDALEMMTHSETPWVKARNNLPPSARSNSVISEDTMLQFCRRMLRQG